MESPSSSKTVPNVSIEALVAFSKTEDGNSNSRDVLSSISNFDSLVPASTMEAGSSSVTPPEEHVPLTTHPDNKKYTEEQHKEIHRIVKAKTPWKVLSINPKKSNGAAITQNDVASAFRKKTMLLHPDRTKFPHAKEAWESM